MIVLVVVVHYVVIKYGSAQYESEIKESQDAQNYDGTYTLGLAIKRRRVVVWIKHQTVKSIA